MFVATSSACSYKLSQADPYICAHLGDAAASCGYKFSDVWTAETQRASKGNSPMDHYFD